MKLFKSFLIFICTLSFTSSFGQWKSINPGAGGQVQDVVCDPSQENVLYLASDMEGVYKSTDNGESWHMTGHLAHNRVYAIAVSPSNNKKLVVGTFNGLHTSNDGGVSYQLVEHSLGNTISATRIDPHDNNVMIAGYGWRDDYNFLGFINIVQGGAPKYFISKNAGENWETVELKNFDLKDRNIIDFVFHPKRKGEIYMSTYSGIFKTTNYGQTWDEIAMPKAHQGHRGVSISPDGKVLYSIFTKDGKKGLPYYSLVDKIKWEKINLGEGKHLEPRRFWYPEVDTRSTTKEHKVLLSLEGDRDGLYEGTFVWEDNELKSYQYDLIWHGTEGYDVGWDHADPNPRFVHYTPKSWERAIWSTSNQTIFQASKNKEEYVWNNKYCKPNDKFKVYHFGKVLPTYAGRGTESTYTYDIAVAHNYVIQGQADNGLMESWDGGYSWSNMYHRQPGLALSDVQSLEIAKAGDHQVVLAQATNGYGGHAKDGRIYFKVLKDYMPSDKWHLLAGGPDAALGMPDGIYREIMVDPHDSSRVYTFSSQHGLYVIDDLKKAIDDPENYKGELISGDELKTIEGVKTIQVHPKNPNVIYLTASRGELGIYKGMKDNGKWTWEKILDGGDWDAEISMWSNNDKTYLLYEGPIVRDEINTSDYLIMLSEDDGETWKEIFTPGQAKTLRGDKNKTWYPYVKDTYKFTSKGGIVGFDNKIIINYYNHRQQNGFGIFMGTIAANGTIDWQDITDDIHYPGFTSSRLVRKTDGNYFYVSTAGAGAWYRKLP
ncbi:beta propeller repeat protein [Flammeovirga pacifica]|uniref:Sortilin N-terminal domain-containing protein n=1 Tax=Flammeovirga pacifica TaxID=915059 RepID=A0A1S1YSA4_FLAPC|nr:hypothetical protein [Flammeovirga pacifica]OHX63900.1 hypothetical protein NH26_20015 [Flammeovirga pacifica]